MTWKDGGDDRICTGRAVLEGKTACLLRQQKDRNESKEKQGRRGVKKMPGPQGLS